MKFPCILVFRKYDDFGRPINGERIIEREVIDYDDKRSNIRELQALDYQLECVMEVP